MGLTDLMAAVVAVLALALSVAAFLYSRRATWASERAAAAAEQSAAAADRSAAVAEREEGRRLKEVEERAVRWRPEPLGNAAVMLRNVGDGTAYDVRVEAREGDQIVGGAQVNGATVPGGEGVRVPASTAGLGRHKQLDVHWRTSQESSVQSRTVDL
jgi:hypothetical protein